MNDPEYTHVDTMRDLKINPSLFVLQKAGQLKQDYFIGQKLGAGSFGYVNYATHRSSGQVRAIKTVRKASITSDVGARRKFMSEIEILKHMNHPGIVKLYEFYEDEYNYHMVTEYLPGGELFDYILKTKSLNELSAAHVMRQLFSAVSYCHANNIVHRDLKPENLLLTSKTELNLKVIDFGTSGLCEPHKKLHAKYGTSYYIAPEVIKGKYNELCDMWSCGVILYIILVGRPPFNGETEKVIMSKAMKGDYSLLGHGWQHISPEAKDLVSRLLSKNTKTRISASQALLHPWITHNFSSPTSERHTQLTLKNLSAFRSEQKLQHAALTFIASQLITKEESRQLTLAFQAIDTNGDGKISREELLEHYSSLANGEEEVNRILAEVDVDGNGFIDYSEFLTATIDKDHYINKSNLMTAFMVFDKDGSGTITTAEIKSLLGADVKSRDTVWRELIAQVDRNGDGVIDVNEFKEMMLRCLN
jgi:calcium-dependent protein kinase